MTDEALTLDPAELDAPLECSKCQKLPPLCVCAEITPFANKIALLVLQHPQEQDKQLGTARLATLHFKNATFKVGLSWPSLTKALGRTADPKRWATLYLGSASPSVAEGDEIAALDSRGALLPGQKTALNEIQGIILLDGTWSQAKTLWWRNPWILKTQRIVLAPHQPSKYGKLRREPRREGLSTLEATSLLLSRLEKKPEIETALTASFERLLAAYRTLAPTQAPSAVRRDFRRRRGPRPGGRPVKSA